MKNADRDLDVIVWGASGFTGRLVAEFIVERYGASRELRWGIGGRSLAKLEEVRRSLAAIDPAAAELPLIVGDASDRASLGAVVTRARVVLSTVGPYAIHGRELVAACVAHGTDYCDLTGEVPFIRDMIDAHHAGAVASGARIVCCCGFDSIPSDLGVLMLQRYATEKYGAPCSEVRFYVMKAKGGVSGGTIASMMNLMESAGRDPRVRKLAFDAYALTPGERGPDGADQQTARYDAGLAQWTGPFVMAAINTRVVRRSNALLGYAWGRNFSYAEVMATGAGAAGWLRATATSVGTGAAMALAAIAPTRDVLKMALPSPGEGPSKQARERGSFEVKLVGLCDGRRLVGTVAGKGDPGYAATARMIAESAVCLAKDELPPGGGVLTPASCMGDALIARLRAAGMRFDVTEDAGA